MTESGSPVHRQPSTANRVAIIGAGPIGLELAVAFRRAGVEDTTLFEILGVDLQGEDHKPRLDETTMETNVPGVFVAGTAVAGSPQERVRVIVEDCHVHVPRIVSAILDRHGRS